LSDFCQAVARRLLVHGANALITCTKTKISQSCGSHTTIIVTNANADDDKREMWAEIVGAPPG
jgi:hypothetical protein